MNVKQNNPLWIKIENFPLDDAGAVINFSQKLAKQQNWSPAFTKRVTEEYRKFIFLCCIAEKGASPSQIVDEAWHLHLTYTQSYWVDFCKNTLGREIHHHPSKGGTDEHHRHEEWYKETLQLYETVFGKAPPTDIWPAPKSIATVVQLPEIVVDNRAKKWAAAFLALPFLFSGILYQELNPFHLTGPEFLFFYFFFGLAVMAACAAIHKKKEAQLQQTVADNLPGDATVFQMAEFLYGRHRAIQTAIVDLIRRELLVVNKDKTIFVLSNRYQPSDKEENPVITSLLATPNGYKTDYKEIATNWYNKESFTHPSLDKLFVYANMETPFLQLGIFYVLLVAMAVARMIQGVYHHKPVTFLFIETVVLLAGFYAIIKSISTRSVVFKKAGELFKEKLALQAGHKDGLVNDFVVNGTPAIAGFAEGFLLASVFNAYSPLSQRFGGDGSDSWSSCGSDGGSSCSGGSSCGGGGCGGCGGGD